MRRTWLSHDLELVDTHNDHVERELLAAIAALQPDGVVLTPPHSDNPLIVGVLARQNIPFARIGSLGQGGGIPLIMDDEGSARKATQALIELGHRRIGFIAGNAEYSLSQWRVDGWRAAMADAGLPTDGLLAASDFSFATGTSAARSLLGQAERPTAIIASNDQTALASLDVAHALGLAVPDDLSLISFDNTPVVRFARPALSAVDQPVAETVARAVDLIIAAQRDGTVPAAPVVVPAALVLREPWRRRVAEAVLAAAPARRSDWPFLLCYALAWAGATAGYGPLLTLLLPLRVAELAGPAAVPWLATLTFIGAVSASLANIAWGWASDRTGHRRAWVAVGLVLSSALLLALPLATTLPGLIALLVAWQAALNMVLGPLAAWAGDCVPDRHKGVLGGLLAFAPAWSGAVGAFVTLPALHGGPGVGFATRVAVLALIVVLDPAPAALRAALDAGSSSGGIGRRHRTMRSHAHRASAAHVAGAAPGATGRSHAVCLHRLLVPVDRCHDASCHHGAHLWSVARPVGAAGPARGALGRSPCGRGARSPCLPRWSRWAW
jgi:DNA-binding LacI/PurR family transcriptional regulator